MTVAVPDDHDLAFGGLAGYVELRDEGLSELTGRKVGDGDSNHGTERRRARARKCFEHNVYQIDRVATPAHCASPGRAVCIEIRARELSLEFRHAQGTRPLPGNGLE